MLRWTLYNAEEFPSYLPKIRATTILEWRRTCGVLKIASVRDRLMPKCAACGTMILFSGKKVNGLRYCNDKCLADGNVARLAQQLPSEIVEVHVLKVHGGPCPECMGPGPVDLRTSHRVISLFVFTQWNNRPHVCCSSCGNKHRLKDAAICLLLGWWGIPWGPPLTLLHLYNNVRGLVRFPDPAHPSDALRQLIRTDLAFRYVASQGGQIPSC